MPAFFPEIDIRPEQAEAMAQALFAVARADGEVHEREAALIAELYAAAADAPSSLGALARAPRIDGATLAAQLPSADLRLLFVKTALLLAYTDSELGAGEAKIIGEYAGALGIAPPQLALLTTQVKEYLLSQLAHLQNVEAAAEVAKKLKL